MGGHRRWGRAVASVAALIIAAMAGAHGQAAPVIFGTVLTADGGLAMPYSVISIASLNREQFTNDHGVFLLSDLPAGTVRLRARHVGFAPRDTNVVLRAGDTVRITIHLPRLAIRLDAMRISSECGAAQDPAGSAALMELFGQVQQNAEQFRLLARSHPFTKRMSRSEISRTIDGKFVNGPIEVLNLVGDANANYKPGKVFRPRRGNNSMFGIVVALPELPDFADAVFIANHCFSYGGDTTIDSVRLVRLAFSPIESLTQPDIRGTVLLHADGYGIAGFVLRTTGVPKELASDIAAIRVSTEFQEILPGISVASQIESFIEPGPDRLRSEPAVASRGEVQLLVEIKWKKGPP